MDLSTLSLRDARGLDGKLVRARVFINSEAWRTEYRGTGYDVAAALSCARPRRGR